MLWRTALALLLQIEHRLARLLFGKPLRWMHDHLAKVTMRVLHRSGVA